MEPSSTLLNLPLPQDVWKTLRSGQLATVELVASGQRQVITQLPTGYGKSKTAILSYAVVRAMGGANRLLVVCPRRNQASQANSEWASDLFSMCGIETTAIDISQEPLVALNSHRNNKAEIFVTTIQALTLSPNTWSVVTDLMQTGRWMAVVDEHHHYANDNTWAEKLSSLSYANLLAMSATPKRQDTRDFFGEPDVRVTYKDAFAEGAVKELSLHEYEYEVDLQVEGQPDCVQTYKTGELFDVFGVKNGDELSEKMTKLKMRWSPKYISPLVLYPASRLGDLRDSGVDSQMIMQAMNCEHAQLLCTQIKALLPTMRVDWVGTGPNGRTQAQNDKTLNKFCPKKNKDGSRSWTLDVLVNVGMAGEGLDTVDVTEISIFTPGNITTSLLQLMGRASRTMPAYDPQPTANINCDTDTELAEGHKYLGRKVMSLFDSDILKPSDIPPDDPEPLDYTEMPEEPVVRIVGVRLTEIKSDPAYAPVLQGFLKSGTQWSEAMAERLVEKLIREERERQDESLAGESELAQLRNEIDKFVGKITGLVIKRIAKKGVRIEKTLAADVKRRINSRKKRYFGHIKECDSTARRAQYKWLKEIERSILDAEGTSGIPSWLR